MTAMIMMLEELGHKPLFLGFLLGLVVVIYIRTSADTMDIPTVSYSRFLPRFLNRSLYYFSGKKIIQDGYKKVSLQK